MKFLLPALIIFCLSTRVDAQSIFQIDALRADGVTLNQGWKYQAGDSAQWASVNYHDDQWPSIDPTKDIHELPELIPGQIGWFRLRFKIDSAVERNLGMIMQCSGASEFYLDGKRIHSFGTISNNSDQIVAYDPLLKPVPLIVPSGSDHVLAVRYTLQPRILYTTMFESRNTAIQIRLLPLQNSIQVFEFLVQSIVGMHLIIIGACLLFAILHLAFYLYYPAQTGNRALSIYAAGYLLFNVVQFYFFLMGHNMSSKFFVANLAMDLRILTDFFLLTALYSLLGRPKDKVYWALVIYGVVSFFLNTWPYDIGWKLGGAQVEILIGIGITRIAYLAVKENKRGSWIILVGTISYFIFFAAFLSYLFMPNQSFLVNLSLLRIVFYVLSFLSIPLATSITLGFEFASTSRSLSDKLIEVKELSEENIRHEKEKQELLTTQNERLELQVKQRTQELSQSIQELKTTQTQLIQSEKMASLGELTAGIAHEIQNPLNFVNNFSEVNKELVGELQQELKAGKIDDAIAISNDIKENEDKINHHGKRADAIVKGMLQHSRTSSGQKELTDINALCDEYVRLAYHGYRAKDKSFNAKFETDLDASLPKINVISQDIGRVVLNLINNAFYAVNERALRQARLPDRQTQGPGYEPQVTVSTKNLGNKIEITVKDNGPGIPDSIKEKIFQPFFTTKPTGQGTGLGLSLSYDIIAAHEGNLELIATTNAGSEFVVRLKSGA
jgi:signal transduction histidine kinase